MTTLIWFRQDLRLQDNPALEIAAGRGPIVPVYIFDRDADPFGPSTKRGLGGASRWWLHHSLAALEKSLGGIVLRQGDAQTHLSDLVKTTGAKTIVWNRCYEPEAIARDTAIKQHFTASGLEVKSFNGSLLHEPWVVKTGSGSPFKVFTPYWRAAQQLSVERPLAAPEFKLSNLPDSDDLSDWKLLPSDPDWAKGWSNLWAPGEAGAWAQFDEFIKNGLNDYGNRRNRPDLENVSRLSPHLHFGEISSRQIWARVKMLEETNAPTANDGQKFLSEIGWREFSHSLLYHFPALPQKNWRASFDAYPWDTNLVALNAWQKGQTGYPLVDAGMRELWHTGYMHNRVRMVAASFLIKHLRIHWRQGEAWFWDTLLDADLANNSAGWQWVAGCGADAAPYFRIFNPTTQAQKFDPNGEYIRKWCPELADLPTKALHAPFDAEVEVLERAGVTLGRTYPKPIVDHARARAAALAGYETVRVARQPAD